MAAAISIQGTDGETEALSHSDHQCSQEQPSLCSSCISRRRSSSQPWPQPGQGPGSVGVGLYSHSTNDQ